MSTIIGLITARGGSKSIPGKNLKALGGRPLIAWTIQAARDSRSLARVILSTDDEQIAHVGRQWGAETPFLRPPELAQDNSTHLSVVEHALDFLADHDGCRPDYILLLQPTSPFRTAADIDAAVELAQRHDAKAVVGVCAYDRHPYLAMRIRDDGTMEDMFPSDIPYLRRQALPPAYAINGAIYLNKPQSLRDERTFFPAGAYPYIMPAERSMDIDEPWDFHVAELILRDKLGRPA